MLSRLARRLFAFRGRLPRSWFWWTLIALGVAFVVLFVFLETALGRASTWVLYPPAIWIAAALLVRRLHDRDRSAGWLLLLALPVIGPLWLFVSLGLRAGTDGENRYGDDPLTFNADYLTVQ